MSYNTILATAPLTTSGYHIKANGTTLGNSLIWDNGTNVGLSTVSPVSTNLVGSMTIVKSYNSDTPVSTTAQTYYTNQSNLYLFGRNAGLSIICPATNEEGSIFFGNSLSVAYASINTGSGTTSVGGDMNFRVGSNTTRMTITSAGNVGIGTTNPSYKLVVSNNGADGLEIIPGTNTSGVVNLLAFNRSGGTYSDMRFDGNNLIFYTNGVGERMRIDTNGRVSITGTTYPLNVYNSVNASGTGAMVTTLGSNANNTSSYHYIATTGAADKFYVFGNGTYQTVSDIRLKKNITKVTDNYLDKVLGLNIVKYNWNDQEDGTPLEFGMIAQEVEELIPSIVHDGRPNEDGNIYKGIQASVLPYILIKAIQEQQVLITSLQDRLIKLESK